MSVALLRLPASPLRLSALFLRLPASPLRLPAPLLRLSSPFLRLSATAASSLRMPAPLLDGPTPRGQVAKFHLNLGLSPRSNGCEGSSAEIMYLIVTLSHRLRLILDSELNVHSPLLL